jgi:large repetitive protein
MCRRGPSLVLLVLALVASPSLAAEPPSGPPRLIADLAGVPSEDGVELTIFGELDGHAYFAAVEPGVSAALWRTDGTAAGTEPLADLEVCPAVCGPSFGEAELAGGKLYFNLFHFPFRQELWVTDGTREGTERLLRLVKPGSQIAQLTAVGGQLWFLATDPDLGEELWTSDGTREGTRLLADLCPGACSSHPQWITPFDDQVAVVASSGNPGPFEHEFDLRLLDPATGEVEAEGLCGGACGFAQRLAVHQGRLYFTALDETHGEEPWVSDGTAAGTRLLMDGRPGPESGGLYTSFSAGGAVYLVVLRDRDEPKVFRTDGTPAGTVPAEEILGALRGRFLESFARPTAAGLVYFAATSEAEGEVLRVFDPAAGEVRALRSGIDLPFVGFEWAALGERIVFAAGEQGFGNEPWVSDGTAAGTFRLADVATPFRSSHPRGFTSLGDRVVFTAEHDFEHQHLWTTDGTPEGTVRIPLAPRSSSRPAGLTPYAGRLWFTARGDDGVRDLWRTTGTGDGAERVAQGPFAPDLTVAHSSLFLRSAAGDPVSLALPDLAPVVLADTQPAREITAGPLGLTWFTTTGRGQELWATDGTPAGTRLVVDLDPDWIDGCSIDEECPPVLEAVAIRMPDQLTPLGDHLYFRAPSPPGTVLFGLWRTDGTAEGTAWLPLAPVGVERIVALGDRLVFHADVPGEDEGQQIWTITPGGAIHGLTHHGSRLVGGLAAAGDAAYYLVETAEGVELHRTGGTIQSSREVALLAGTSLLSDVGQLVAAGGRVYFPVDTPELGNELWTSDGTAAGTGPVADLHPGPAGSNPTAATPAGPYLVFTADDGASGREPWVTDGTAAGTVRLADLAPGPGFTGPREYAVVGDSLYFDGDDGVRGQELWAVASGADGGGTPGGVPDDAVGIVAPEYPGFRFWVRISANGQTLPARRELLCLPETVCVSGALPGRSELFLRIVGPRPNGFLWPILVRFTTSRVEVWIEQVSTGVLQHYVLDAATPGSDELNGLFDRRGFLQD